MPIRICGTQPGYLPWLGYFDQMMRVDAFLIADELQFSSSGWTHRNRVLGPSGVQWLTLPARPRSGERIATVELDSSIPWVRKHMRSLRHFYASDPGTRNVIDELATVLGPEPTRLTQASIPTIRFLAERLGVTTPLLVSSELGLEAKYEARFPDKPGPCHRIIAYMDALGATELLEGETGQSYIDHDLFGSFGKRVTFHRYRHPEYEQLNGTSFVSHLSAIDLLLSVGTERARAVLRESSLHNG